MKLWKCEFIVSLVFLIRRAVVNVINKYYYTSLKILNISLSFFKLNNIASSRAVALFRVHFAGVACTKYCS